MYQRQYREQLLSEQKNRKKQHPEEQAEEEGSLSEEEDVDIQSLSPPLPSSALSTSLPRTVPLHLSEEEEENDDEEDEDY